MLTALERFGFQKASAEHGVFYLSNDKGHCMLGLYVDDLIIAGSSDAAISDVKKYLATQSKMKYLGLINGRFLGLDIKLVEDGIIVSMATYVKDMLTATGLAECHRETTPMMLNPYMLQRLPAPVASGRCRTACTSAPVAHQCRGAAPALWLSLLPCSGV